MRLIIELPMLERTVILPETLDRLAVLTPHELDRNTEPATMKVKEREEWELSEVGRYTVGAARSEKDTFFKSVCAIREITGLGLKEAKDLVEGMLRRQPHDDVVYVFRRCL